MEEKILNELKNINLQIQEFDSKIDEKLIYNKNKRDVFGKSLRINLHQIKNSESDDYEL